MSERSRARPLLVGAAVMASVAGAGWFLATGTRDITSTYGSLAGGWGGLVFLTVLLLSSMITLGMRVGLRRVGQYSRAQGAYYSSPYW